MNNCLRIALVMPYYGKLPTYFNFFLRSLEGMNFDVLFFSDLKVERSPENFKLFEMTFDAFKRLAAEKIGIPVRLDSPKRLCDFRPMYGKIFEDYLTGYDYWAFGDCDLVYGRQFPKEVADAVASGCDLFTLHKHYIAGPFCMIRNDARMNNLWQSADNWREVVARAGINVAFDELHGDWHGRLATGKMTIEECRAHGDSFTAVILRTPNLRLRMQEIISESALCGEVVRMDAGLLVRCGQEIKLFHFLGSKLRNYFTCVDADYDQIADYVIDDAGFYVSNWQQNFRLMINITRKFKAAVRSLRNNGVARLSPRWQKGPGGAK